MNDERRWQAILDRDKSMDGDFVFAVRTTGIYCKPSCAARRPKRENVIFFDGPEEAEAAGFRACMRCNPKGVVEPAPGAEIAEKASRYIEANLEGGDLTLAGIGAHVGVSPYHLQRVFRKVMGVSPRQYVAALRLERLKSGLKSGENVTNAMYDAGYASSSRLYEGAHSGMGMTPGSYKKGGKGMTITYTIRDCSLGRMLVGATERGICSVGLANSDLSLLDGLHREYPAARTLRDDKALEGWAKEIIESLEERRPELQTLPVDVHGTDFQESVWRAIRTIPYGATRSYGEVARAIGQPSAVRAVAQACGSNHVALVIPCHRVVREDGSLGGYKWGVERKEAILAHERELVPAV